MAYNIAPSKQDLLVSGTNIQTINGNNILGSGNLTIAGLPSAVAGDVDKVVSVDALGVSSWQYAGLGAGSLGTNNVVLGRSKPASLSGTNNTIVGQGSATGITTASYNTIIGAAAGDPITTNGQCTYVGYSAGQNTAGPYSVCVGDSTETANSGTAIGSQAKGYSASVAVGASSEAGTNGGVNTCVAIGALAKAGTNTTNGCIAVGYSAFSGGTEGVVIGKNSRSGTGNNQVIIGANSGRASAGSTGSGNTVIGDSSFNSSTQTTAANNTILGQGSGTGLTTGSSNVLLGNATSQGATNSDSVVIGSSASSTANTTLAIGKSATVSGAESIAIGGFSYARGNASVVVGAYAGNTGDTAVRDVLIGYGSGYNAAKSGGNNVAVGFFSGYNLTSGASNILLGSSAGVNLSSGSSNVFLNGGGSVTTGSSNVLINSTAGTTNLSSAVGIGVSSDVTSSSVAIGSGASATGAESVAIGVASYAKASGNVTVGAYTGHPGDTSNYSVYIGYGAGYTSAKSGANTTAVGMWAGRDLTSGANNTFLGKQAGLATTSGSLNVFLGQGAGDAVTTGSNNVIIGDIAGTTTLSDTIILGAGTAERLRIDSSGVVRINETARIGYNVSEVLEVKGVIKAVGTDASTLGFLYAVGDGTTWGGGIQIWKDNSTPNDCWGIGMQVPGAAISDDFVISNADGGWHEILRIKKAGDVIINETGASIDVRIEGDTDSNLLVTDGSADKVGIGTATPQEKLDVGTGNLRVSNGDCILNTAGNGLKIKTGTNATAGIETGLSSVSTVTINTTKALTGSLIFVQPMNTTDKHGFSVASISNGTSFTVDFSGNYTGDLAWFIINPA